jgi:hypothetical protein
MSIFSSVQMQTVLGIPVPLILWTVPCSLNLWVVSVLRCVLTERTDWKCQFLTTGRWLFVRPNSMVIQTFSSLDRLLDIVNFRFYWLWPELVPNSYSKLMDTMLCSSWFQKGKGKKKKTEKFLVFAPLREESPSMVSSPTCRWNSKMYAVSDFF